ncbi:helix-turn-helix transcriptional regulator [uncultured Parabacteroides sp.]|uniref:helix-turn-helix domain-containing protein n=1 Tax=uncultured Parabacteroides sp. TaxID=512312 RepID=UPI002804E6A9|nr:helix-turn-helix transcriptional regulator [uncultured Parabacteroides sp.]
MELRIKEVIREQGFTVQSVADKIGKSKQSLHGIIEKGNPTINTLSDIADAINVPISKLYEEAIGEGELTALIQHKGDFYKATTIEELEKIVAEIKEKAD